MVEDEFDIVRRLIFAFVGLIAVTVGVMSLSIVKDILRKIQDIIVYDIDNREELLELCSYICFGYVLITFIAIPFILSGLKAIFSPDYYIEDED